ncbi:response regulator [Massilia sp. CCM 8695]|uniref:Response regulator n=1 Tax=Massilia frigida TaxID=2609281 RepID=A0ABX0NHM1_9BURK|nr:LytTR family DNA-binding domain-containing protein [Massilia frigida]NHZ81755.1 response regulator [Massilia frigida]
MRALIADDEPHLALYLQQQLAMLWPELEIVQLANNGVEAAQGIATLQPELAFLDIQMPGLTGLEVAQGIEGATKVVFVTAYDSHAVEAFEHAALDYILKPVKTERLARTLERIRAACAPAQDDARLSRALARLLAAPPQPRLRYIRAAQGELTYQVAVEDVLFFHADDKYTVVATRAGEHLIRTSLTELAAQLDPERFWQVHRSTLVNLAFLDGTRRDESGRLFLRVRGHARELPVSRAFVHLFKPM